MHWSYYADDVVVWAPAKVNLFLEILAKRPDGYHDLATLMATVRLHDTLVLQDDPTGALNLTCTRSDLSTGPDNLVLRAAERLRQHVGKKRGARIRLVKRIPMQAGLAGGSTDAAATLLGLNQLWKLQLPITELAELAAKLGSDVAFFLHGDTAWCTGRGEVVEPVTCGRPIDLVLLCPKFGMPTPAVYREVKVPAEPVSGDAIRTALVQGDLEALGRLLHNRLQPAAEKLDPRIAEYHRRLAETDPLGSLMSGSGSSLFAVCRDEVDAQRVAAELRRRADAGEFEVHVTRTCG
jgi:4-diphosphocytidyl-2-C-methyl-D-erythritol kinase